jgi:hypothetical protein
MEQRHDHKSMQNFSILCIVIGVILILSAIVGGVSYIVVLARGLVGHTLTSVRSLVIGIAFDFCVPLAGGIALLLAALRIIKEDTAEFEKNINRATRKRVTDKKDEIINVFLNKNEKEVFELIKGDDGILQSELVIKTGYSKVKMHRILKSLENKNLIKKGRFGITNKIVVNKH